MWRCAAVAAVPLAALLLFYCLRPVAYDTGSNSVEVYSYPAAAARGEPLCIGDLDVPAGTAAIRMQAQPQVPRVPTMVMTLSLAGRPPLASALGPRALAGSGPVSVVFPIPRLAAKPSSGPGTLCVRAAAPVAWGGTPLPAPPASAPTLGGAPVAGRIAVWFEPPAGASSSYVSRLGSILDRAALFRPSPVGPWLYAVILFVVLPALAFAAVRTLALASAGRRSRLGVWLYAIAALNFICWSLITPPFQAPDEVDHFAYTQSLVERGREPATQASSPLARWSDSETLALEDMSFFTDHQIGDSKPPWLSARERRFRADFRRLRPRASNGGGYETAATHGPIYYAALAPAYALASGSPLSQLTLMRILSALIGALAVVCAYLLVREIAPGRPWLAVLAGLLVAFEPMYGFISGAVNNDVGVNAGAAALELLMIRVLRRGITLPTGVAGAALAVLLPMVKGTILSLYPLLAAVVAVALWRRHSRSDVRAWLATAATAVVVAVLASVAFSSWVPPATAGGGGGAVSTDTGSISAALHHLPSFASYLWQVFLPRLPFMHAHFPGGGIPGYTIFVERGWGAFGWYDVLFPNWVFVVILVAMLAAIPLGALAASREWAWLRRNVLVVVAVLAMPVLVVIGFEAAFFTQTIRPLIAEFGRYAFPAIAPLAAIVVGVLHAAGRRRALEAGAVLLVAMIALSLGGQLLTLTRFYA